MRAVVVQALVQAQKKALNLEADVLLARVRLVLDSLSVQVGKGCKDLGCSLPLNKTREPGQIPCILC